MAGRKKPTKEERWSEALKLLKNVPSEFEVMPPMETIVRYFPLMREGFIEDQPGKNGRVWKLTQRGKDHINKRQQDLNTLIAVTMKGHKA